jgi:hypothetical protein
VPSFPWLNCGIKHAFGGIDWPLFGKRIAEIIHKAQGVARENQFILIKREGAPAAPQNARKRTTA